MRVHLVLALLLLVGDTSAKESSPTGHPVIANQGRSLCWFAADGKLVTKKELKGAPHDIHVLENGNVLTHQNTEIVELDARTRETVWSFDAKSLATVSRVELHSFAMLPSGHLMVALSGEGKLFEIDRKGVVHKTITLQRDHPDPHRDTRLVRPVIQGDDWTYLVAQEGDGFVREYNRDGEIIWEYDVPLFDQAPKGGHGPEAFGDAVFSAIRLENGNTLVGTGNGHSILEVTPEKEIVWQVHQDDLPGIKLAWVTTLQLLENGNIVIGNCHAGPGQPQIVEITRDKKVVWTLQDFEHLGNAVSNSVVLR